MAIRVAINGFGRIGRAFARLSQNRDMGSTGSPQVDSTHSIDSGQAGSPQIEIVAVNDLGSLENLAYLLKYDTVYGQAPFSVELGKVRLSHEGGDNGALVIDGREVKFF